MTFENANKNPNELHDFLIGNSCIPNYLAHNAEYDDAGEKVEEATEIVIDIKQEKEQELIDLVNQFMTQ